MIDERLVRLRDDIFGGPPLAGCDVVVADVPSKRWKWRMLEHQIDQCGGDHEPDSDARSDRSAGSGADPDCAEARGCEPAEGQAEGAD